MKLLLDTHVAIWAVTADRRLSAATMAMIADGGNDVSISIASLWEIAIKNNLRRPQRDPIAIGVEQAAREFAAADFRTIDLGLRHLRDVETLEHAHGDPFDRILVAQARAEGMRLVTHDRALGAYGDAVMAL